MAQGAFRASLPCKLQLHLGARGGSCKESNARLSSPRSTTKLTQAHTPSPNGPVSYQLQLLATAPKLPIAPSSLAPERPITPRSQTLLLPRPLVLSFFLAW